MPFIQRYIAASVAHALSEKLQTEVTIRRVDIGLLNRLIIDDLQINDRSKKELLSATRFSAQYEIMPLFKGKIIIHSVQLFGFSLRLNKLTPHSVPNYQFVIDAFKSKKKTTSNPLELHINSIILRRGRLFYDIFSVPQTADRFNASHIHIHNLSTRLTLRSIKKDSLNVGAKQMSFDEESGLSVGELSLKVESNKKQMTISNFNLELEHSSLNFNDVKLTYDNMDAFKDITNKVRFNISTQPSYITLSDISMFVPALQNFKERLHLSLAAKGTVNHCNISTLKVDAGRKLQIALNGSLIGITHPADAYFNTNIPKLFINGQGIGFIIHNLVKTKGKAPEILSDIGDLSFQGHLSGYLAKISVNGLLHGAGGSLKTNIQLGHQKSTYTCRGEMNGNNLNLGKVLGSNKWGVADFDLKVDALSSKKMHYPVVQLQGLVSNLSYNSYTYKNINVNGLYKDGGFKGKAAMDDPNGKIHLRGDMNVRSKVPSFDFTADLNNVRPHDLRLTEKYKNSKFSVHVKANFTGGSLDKMIGEINVDSLSFTSPDKNYFLRSVQVRSAYQDKQKVLTLKSEIADAEFKGDFRYRTLYASVKNILSYYLPSLVKPIRLRSSNDFNFRINIYNTEILPNIFDIPLHVGAYSHVSGYVNDPKHVIRVEGFAPEVRYKDKQFQSGYLLCENPNGKMHSVLRFNQLNKTGAMSYMLNTYAQNDTLNTTLSWGNNAEHTFSGELNAVARFFKSDDRKHIKAQLNVNPTNVIVNDTTWQIHPSQVTVDKGHVDIADFMFSHGNRHIHIDGRVSSSPHDTLKVNLEDINLSYIFATINFDDVDFKGEVSGDVYASNVMKKPHVNGLLSVRNFTFNDGPLGDGTVAAAWDDVEQGVSLDAHLAEGDVSKTHVKGYIFPSPKNGLDLEIDADNTNMKFTQYYLSSIFDELNGRMTGKAHLSGKFKELILKVDALANAKMKVGILNTSFNLRDSLHITPTGIDFKDAKIYDPEGHEGTCNGSVTYKYLRDFNFNLRLNFADMLIMNTHETDDMPFYGKIYATGNALLQGGTGKGLEVITAVRTDKNTNFVYINRSTSSAINNQFISFVDKTPRRTVDTVAVFNPLEDVLKNVAGDIRLNLQVDATPDATVKIIMDPIAGDNIVARGSGNIRGEYYNKGDFRMFGTYNINEGKYKFSLQEVIRKDFTIKNGSSISFNGPPLSSTLNVQASYTVNSASLTDLIPNASNIVSQTNVKVNCLMNLTGVLTHPTINFNLEMPNERDEIQTLVKNYISTDEQMNTQILYLLSIGKFYMADNTSTGQQYSNRVSSVLSSTISGQLNNILSQLDIANWNFGTNLSTGQNGWTDMEIEGMLSGSLLNNRLIVNGNFGYRDNPLANSNFIGDFEAEWLLNRNGTIRLKAYNETNDRYYTKTNLTTQGIGIIVQKEFNKWRELFFWRHWHLKALLDKKRRQAASNEKNK
jgi:hypothetical protein